MIVGILALAMGGMNAHAEEIGGLKMSLRMSDLSQVYGAKDLDTHLYAEKTCKNTTEMEMRAYGQFEEIMPETMRDRDTKCDVAGVDEEGMSTFQLKRVGSKTFAVIKHKGYLDSEQKKYPLENDEVWEIKFTRGDWGRYANGDSIAFELAESNNYKEMIAAMMKKMARISGKAITDQLPPEMKQHYSPNGPLKVDVQINSPNLDDVAQYRCEGSVVSLNCDYEGDIKLDMKIRFIAQ